MSNFRASRSVIMIARVRRLFCLSKPGFVFLARVIQGPGTMAAYRCRRRTCRILNGLLRGGATHARSQPRGWQRQCFVAFLILLVSSWLLLGGAEAAEQARPVRIGVLTPAWGPPPQAVGLRDGLLELGYREKEDLFIGVRFTQGDLAALQAAAHELVQLGVDLIFTHRDDSASPGAYDRAGGVVSGRPACPLTLP